MLRGAAAQPARRIEDARRAPDFALVNGQFVDHRGIVGDSLTVADGRIAGIGFGLAAGAAAEAGPGIAAEAGPGVAPRAADGIELIDLGGRTVIPGFVDAHVHYTRAGVNPGFQARRVERAFSIDELQQTIAARAAEVPAGRLITCIGGWNHLQLREARRPTAAELDEAAPDHAVYLAGTGGGTGAITNSLGRAFLAARGVAVDAATGVVASPGEALAALRSDETREDRLRGTLELNAHAASLGLTAVVNAGNFEDQDLPLALWRDDRLGIRMRPLYPADSPEDVARHVGGGFGQSGRAVGDDLYRPAGFGERIGGTNTMSDQFEPTAREIARQGWLLQQHSITREENAFHLDAFERIAREFPIAPLHWALIHLQDISAEDLGRLGALGAGASAQTWTYLSTAGGPPFRRIVDAGIPAGVGTDSTNVAALDPWLSFFYMTTGRNLAGEPTNEAQRIGRLEALRLYTAGAAWFCFDEDSLGSFETGKLADLAVLSHAVLDVPDETLRRIESVLTLVGGRVVHAGAPFA